MNIFSHHAPCPKCGSADNVSVYQDGFEICHTPGCDYLKKSDGATYNKDSSNSNASYFPLMEGTNPTFLIQQRGITSEALSTYNVKRIQIGKAIIVQFPYYLNGVPVAAKYRACTGEHGKPIWENKQYWSKGVITQSRLFGMQTCSTKKRSVIITEGELDALAAYSMYGLVHNVVSVANGAQSAAHAIKHHIDWLMQWDTIYINFDMDEPGQMAAADVMSLLPVGRVKNVILPMGYKDACDMSKDGKGQEYRDAIKSAQGIVPPGVLSQEEVIASTLDYIMDVDQRKGVSTGYKSLDNIMGGFRPGELVTLVAGTGVGKTTMTLNLTYNAAIQAKMNTLFIPLEMSYKQVLVRLMEIHTKQVLMTANGQNNPICDNEQKIKQLLTEVTNYVSIYNHIGSLDLKKLVNVLEYYAIAHGTKLIVLDHKDAAVNTLSDEGGGVKLIDNLMSELKRVALQYNLTVLVVSHQSRSKEDKEDSKASLSRVRGSAGVAQNSDIVIGLERDRKEDILTITTLKAHRIFGIYDQFHLFYNRNTLRIEEVLFNEDEQQHDTNEKRVREKDQGSKPLPTVRASQDTVHKELHPRLPTADAVREGDIHRSKGTLHTSRQNKATSSKGSASRIRLADIISTSKQSSESKVEAFFYLCRLGDEKRLQMGRRSGNTERMEI